MAKNVIRNTAIALLTLAAACALSLIFQRLDVTEHITTVFVFAVFIISLLTEGYLYGILSAVAGMVAINFAFTYPFFSFDFITPINVISAVIMLAVAVITGMLTTKIKTYEAAKLESEREKMRANLLRAVSHDLRTPLTSISGNASNLLSNYRKLDDGARERIFTDIYEDSMWLINLVENLLAVTRLEDGQVRLHQSVELMDEVVAEALRHTSRKSKSHTIRVSSAQELILAKIDARLVVQVLINLTDNAIKYTQEGSCIEIHTEQKDGWVVVSVSDNGPGIPDEQKMHVFDMFYSGANKLADSRRSLGLGLSLCRSIVNAHGGTITVSDNHPEGTVFTFTLPAGEVELHE